jgi:hypothetical protein
MATHTPVESSLHAKNCTVTPDRKSSDSISVYTDQANKSSKSNNTQQGAIFREVHASSNPGVEKFSYKGVEKKSPSTLSNQFVDHISTMTLDRFWENNSEKFSNKTAEIQSHHSYGQTYERVSNPPIRPVHFYREEASSNSISNAENRFGPPMSYHGPSYPHAQYKNFYPGMPQKHQFMPPQMSHYSVHHESLKSMETQVKLVSYLKKKLSRYPQLVERLEASKIPLDSLFVGPSCRSQLEFCGLFTAPEISQISLMVNSARESFDDDLLIEETMPRQEEARSLRAKIIK